MNLEFDSNESLVQHLKCVWNLVLITLLLLVTCYLLVEHSSNY